MASRRCAANVNTQEQLVRDLAGNAVLDEHDVYTGSGPAFARTGWTYREYDPFGHLANEYRSNGTQTSRTWDCCLLSSSTDETGIVTTYNYDPVLKRIDDQTRAEIPASSAGPGYPGQAAIVTHPEYSVANGLRIIETSISSGSLSLLTTRKYDLAGRTTEDTDAANLTAVYTYDDNWGDGDGRKVTVTRPGGASEITEYYRDGRVKRIYSDNSPPAVVERNYKYCVNTDGTLCTIVTTGTGTPARSVTTTYDLLGRLVREEQPGYNGATITTTNFYDESTGRLLHTSMTGRADTWYEYDALGNVKRSGLDLNGTPGL